ncbi:MAG: MBL fold metallo-hydrolase [bacterium]|nr:MBL fold metallo-hydrolase [bacterium]
MKLSFYGAARTVTGSKHLVEVNGTRILLDCGTFQGRRDDSYTENLNFPFDPKTIDILILSHAHIDHSGNIPNLVKQGFNGDIICTPATRDLCSTMLPDSGFIQEKDAIFVNKKHKQRGEALVEPIYTYEDAVKCIQYFTTRGYGRRATIANGVGLTFHDAGHMLGSANIELDIVDRETNRDYRLIFSGDIGRAGIPIIRDPEVLDGGEFLIMESTYGDRLHEAYADSEKKLEKIITDTYRRNGSIIMPAFAVGRTQQIVYTLHQLLQKGDIPKMPIYVDSPLAVNTTSVFQLHTECFDDEIRKFMNEINTHDPFGFELVTYVRELEESKRLNFKREPCIIISASGMAEFGRVVHHISNRIDDPKNTILITGWQAPNTLGRKLVDKNPIVRIFGEEHHVRAQVEVLNGFSGHADHDELMNWVGGMRQKPEKIFLVHGEEKASSALQKSLSDHFNMQVHVPVQKQQFTL